MVSYLTKKEPLHKVPLKTEITTVFQLKFIKKIKQLINYFPKYFMLTPKESVAPSILYVILGQLSSGYVS